MFRAAGISPAKIKGICRMGSPYHLQLLHRVLLRCGQRLMALGRNFPLAEDGFHFQLQRFAGGRRLDAPGLAGKTRQHRRIAGVARVHRKTITLHYSAFRKRPQRQRSGDKLDAIQRLFVGMSNYSMHGAVAGFNPKGVRERPEIQTFLIKATRSPAI